ncbi:hypothetical protein D3C87_1405600 [compost metagenome]
MIGDVAVGGGQFDHFVHDLFRVTGAGADLDPLLAQVGDGLQRPRNQRRVFGDFFDLQRHEALVNRRDVIVGRRAAEHCAIAFGNLRLIAQGADVVPLAHAHRATGLFDGHLDVELGEGLDENLRRSEGAEVDHGAGPVEDGGLQFGWVGVVHGN